MIEAPAFTGERLAIRTAPVSFRSRGGGELEFFTYVRSGPVRPTQNPVMSLIVCDDLKRSCLLKYDHEDVVD